MDTNSNHPLYSPRSRSSIFSERLSPSYASPSDHCWDRFLTRFYIAVSLSATADAYNAFTRVQEVFNAEVIEEDIKIDPSHDLAVSVKKASFTWDAPPPPPVAKPAAKSIKVTEKVKEVIKKKPLEVAAKLTEKDVSEKPSESDDRIFKLKNINLSIPRGQMCAIVGPIGSGKSSLLQGLVGGQTI